MESLFSSKRNYILDIAEIWGKNDFEGYALRAYTTNHSSKKPRYVESKFERIASIWGISEEELFKISPEIIKEAEQMQNFSISEGIRVSPGIMSEKLAKILEKHKIPFRILGKKR